MQKSQETKEAQQNKEQKKSSPRRSSPTWKRALPSLLISLAFHLMILALIGLLPSEEQREELPVVITSPDFVDPEHFDREEPIVTILPPAHDAAVPVEQPSFQPEPLQQDQQAETVPDLDEPELDPDTYHDSDFPEVFDQNPTANQLPTLAMIGKSIGSGSPAPHVSNRRGDHKTKLLQKEGGDQQVVNAVEKALAWLAAHQEEDGSWDASRWEGKAHKGRVPETSAAVLAFLGAGYSERMGKYRQELRRAVSYLNRQVMDNQQKNKKPVWGRTYGSALMLMALSEATIFGSSPRSKRSANIIAKHLLDSHKSHGTGWHYNSGGDDFSVSGWVALALKNAKEAYLPITTSDDFMLVMKQYQHWVHHVMSDPKTGTAYYRSPEPNKKGTRNMTWVSMVVKSFFKTQTKDPFMEKASQNSIPWADIVLKDEPKDSYGIYYGTLAAFMRGGKLWQWWNPRMKRCLIASQQTGPSEQLGGSWNPTTSHTGEQGGRVLDTALFALCLEVYYRYERM